MRRVTIGIALSACVFASDLGAQPKPRVGGAEPPNVAVPPVAQVNPSLGIARPGPVVARPPIPQAKHAFARTPLRRLEIVNRARAGFGLPPTTLTAMKLDRPAIARVTPQYPKTPNAAMNLVGPKYVNMYGDTGSVMFFARGNMSDGTSVGGVDGRASYTWIDFTGIEKKLHVLACAVQADAGTRFGFNDGPTRAITTADADGYVYFAFRSTTADFSIHMIPILGGDPLFFGCELDPAE